MGALGWVPLPKPGCDASPCRSRSTAQERGDPDVGGRAPDGDLEACLRETLDGLAAGGIVDRPEVEAGGGALGTREGPPARARVALDHLAERVAAGLETVHARSEPVGAGDEEAAAGGAGQRVVGVHERERAASAGCAREKLDRLDPEEPGGRPPWPLAAVRQALDVGQAMRVPCELVGAGVADGKRDALGVPGLGGLHQRRGGGRVLVQPLAER